MGEQRGGDDGAPVYIGYLRSFVVTGGGRATAYLSVDHRGRPVEFVHGVPEEPDAVTRLLYGPTLAASSDVATAQAILREIKSAPACILTESEALFDAAANSSHTVAYISKANDSVGSSGSAGGVAWRIRTPGGRDDDRVTVALSAAKVEDVFEPFERAQAVLAEILQQDVD